jgi:hypothetical protein
MVRRVLWDRAYESRRGRSDAGLGHLEHRATDAVAIADATWSSASPSTVKILAELSVHKIIARELLLPAAVGIELVDEHRPLSSAMPGAVTVSVGVDVQAAHRPQAGDPFLPHRSVHRPAPPGDTPWHAYID